MQKLAKEGGWSTKDTLVLHYQRYFGASHSFTKDMKNGLNYKINPSIGKTLQKNLAA